MGFRKIKNPLSKNNKAIRIKKRMKNKLIKKLIKIRRAIAKILRKIDRQIEKGLKGMGPDDFNGWS